VDHEIGLQACGGLRDRGKRPLGWIITSLNMIALEPAARIADHSNPFGIANWRRREGNAGDGHRVHARGNGRCTYRDGKRLAWRRAHGHAHLGPVELHGGATRRIGNDARFQPARPKLQPFERLGRSGGEPCDKVEAGNEEAKRCSEHDAFSRCEQTIFGE
jgi:hypothetical protein